MDTHDSEWTYRVDSAVAPPAVIEFRERLVAAGDVGCQIHGCAASGPLVHIAVSATSGCPMVVACCPSHAPIAAGMLGTLANGLAVGPPAEVGAVVAGREDPAPSLVGTGTTRAYWTWIAEVHDRVRLAELTGCDHPACHRETAVTTIVTAPGRGTWVTGSCSDHSMWAGMWAQRIVLGVS